MFHEFATSRVYKSNNNGLTVIKTIPHVQWQENNQ